MPSKENGLHNMLWLSLSDSRKYPCYTTDSFLEFRVQGGFFELKIRRHGRILTIGIVRAWGVFRPGISTGTDKSVFLENTYFMDFISLQIKHELTTQLTTAEAGCKMPF